MRILVLVCLIMGLALALFARNANQTTRLQLREREIAAHALPTEPRVTPSAETKNFSVVKPNVSAMALPHKREIASKPSYTVEPGEFRYERDPENRDYIEEGVSLEDIEREK